MRRPLSVAASIVALYDGCISPSGAARLRRTLFGTPVAPVLREPVREHPRLLLVEPRAEKQGFLAQLALAAIDEREQRVERARVAERIAMRARRFPQHAEVVLLAEIIGELVRLIRQLADHAGPQRLDDFELITQILHLLAPFVKRVRGCRFAGGSHRA